MALKPETSLIVGLGTATLVYGIYQAALPPIADVRVAESDNRDIQASERLASWTSAAVVAGVSLITKDPTIFILGGSMVIVLAWWHRHADQVSPLTGKAVGSFFSPPMTQEQLPTDFGYEDSMPTFAG